MNAVNVLGVALCVIIYLITVAFICAYVLEATRKYKRRDG